MQLCTSHFSSVDTFILHRNQVVIDK